jgi:hypothetical protein
LGFIGGLLISHPLWFNDRFYPFAPAADFIPILPPPFGTIIFVGLIILLAAIIFYPNKYIFGGLFSLIIFSVLQDQSRLYPWVYQYSFILSILAWSHTSPQQNNFKPTFKSIQIVLIGTYVWSGLHKLNYTYLSETFEWLIGPLLQIIPYSNQQSFFWLAIFTAIIEAGAGIALAFQKSRKIGAILLIGMHSFILLMVGPIGMEYNTVVWPWNVSFILLLASIFLADLNEVPKTLSSLRLVSIKGIAILVFLMLPILNFSGYWDNFPSASLYSGKKPYAKVHLTDHVKGQFPAEVQAKVSLLNELSIRDWAYTELHVPDYPQPRVYKDIFRQLCTYQENKYGLVLEIYHTADLVTGKRKREEFFCHEIVGN